MLVLNIGRQGAAQVTLIENDNVIETLAPDQTNDPLASMIIDQGEVVHESSAQELLAGVVASQAQPSARRRGRRD